MKDIKIGLFILMIGLFVYSIVSYKIWGYHVAGILGIMFLISIGWGDYKKTERKI